MCRVRGGFYRPIIPGKEQTKAKKIMAFTNEEMLRMMEEMTKANNMLWWSHGDQFFSTLGNASIHLNPIWQLGRGKTSLGGHVDIIREGIIIHTIGGTSNAVPLIDVVISKAKSATEDFYAQLAIEYLQHQVSKAIIGKDDAKPEDDNRIFM